MSKAQAFAPTPIVDALAGLTGDKAAHCASVAYIVADALASIVQHGNSGPVHKAAVYVASLKGTTKGVLAVRDAFAAAVACVPFLTVGSADGSLTDTRERKRGDKSAADAVREEAAEAFVLAYGTRMHSEKPKKATKGEKARKALETLRGLTGAELGKLLADTDSHGLFADAVSRAVAMIAAEKAAAGIKAAATRKPKEGDKVRRVHPVVAEVKPQGAALTSAIADALTRAGVPEVAAA